jgi:hypothetical protein
MAINTPGPLPQPNTEWAKGPPSLAFAQYMQTLDAAVRALVATAAPPRGYIGSGNCSAAGGTQTFSVNSGVWTSDDQTTSMVLASNYTKTMSAWAVGSGNGSLDTGAVAANTWYHVFLIERIDTGVVDVLTSLSATAPTLPANYTVKRRTWSLKTDATPNIIAATQVGVETIWAASPLDVNTATLGTSRSLFTLSVPPGYKVNALFRAAFINASVGVAGILTSPDEADQSPAANADLGGIQAANQFSAERYSVRTNTSAQIGARSSAASTTLQISTFGWLDPSRWT